MSFSLDDILRQRLALDEGTLALGGLDVSPNFFDGCATLIVLSRKAVDRTQNNFIGLENCPSYNQHYLFRTEFPLRRG